MDRDSFQHRFYKEKGNNHLRFIVFFCLLVMSWLVSVVVAADDKVLPNTVAVVNVPYLMENSPRAQLESERLKQRFLPQEKALEDAQKQIEALEKQLADDEDQLSAQQKQQRKRDIRAKIRARTRALQDFREELRFQRDNALDEVQKEVFEAISTVRQSLKIDIVLQEYVSASERVDITSAVIEYLKQQVSSDVSETSVNNTAQ